MSLTWEQQLGNHHVPRQGFVKKPIPVYGLKVGAPVTVMGPGDSPEECPGYRIRFGDGKSGFALRSEIVLK